MGSRQPRKRLEKSAVAQVATSKQSSDTSGEVSSVQCVLCGEGTHPLYLCDLFTKMSAKSRFEFVCQKRLRFVCFSPRHKAQTCTRTPTCHIVECNRKHSRLIHFDNRSACEPQSPHTTVVLTPQIVLSVLYVIPRAMCMYQWCRLLSVVCCPRGFCLIRILQIRLCQPS